MVCWAQPLLSKSRGALITLVLVCLPTSLSLVSGLILTSKDQYMADNSLDFEIEGKCVFVLVNYD